MAVEQNKRLAQGELGHTPHLTGILRQDVSLPVSEHRVTDVWFVLRHKRAACLSAHGSSQAFYGAVIQARGGDSCGSPSHSISPTGALKLGKCHQFGNALFPLLLSLLIPLLARAFYRGFSQWSG